ncbi:ABC transporter ATP-binding protein [Roseobacter sp. CCS2]|uniref:ABC transporter ATP-binding protein n=1 Tax=Roseobacter sp. CCS2 TaxID=391593 RepID=UPI0000F3F18A|nr:ABC transporter ATP-binding protein [Roseobacter sp. CCS2]EBA11178.1 probable oligopeptide atp-binding abc transporter protein [Roseobacter sp. CCS2]
MTEILKVTGLCTHFFTRAGVVKAVDGVDISLNRGEVLGLVGESGSGKSITGFSIMNLIDAPGRMTGGRISFKGRDLSQLSETAWQDLRGNRIAMIFQDPMMTLNPVLRIDVQMIEAIQAHEKVSRTTARERARDTLGMVGIPAPDERLKAYPHQLSGGMRQRVAIAIAFLNKPDLIIADEPTTALDVTIQSQIIHEAQKLTRQTGTAMIWISHDLAVVAGIADQISVMYAGRIVEHGPTDYVIDNPRHPYTYGLLGSVPSANKRGARLFQIDGMAPNMLALPRGCAFGPRCDRAVDVCAAAPGMSQSCTQKFRCHNPVPEAVKVAK